MLIIRLFGSFVLLIACLAGPGAARADDVSATAVEAVERAGQGDFDAAYALAGTDAVTADLVTWMRLRAGKGAFAEYVAFPSKRPDWPDADELRARAEDAIAPEADPQQVLDWFAGEEPQTGIGVLRLAEALMKSGQIERAKTLLRSAWVEMAMDQTGQAALLAAFPDVLAPLHAARADALLWRWRTRDASRLIPLLDEDQAALVRARIALIHGDGQEDKALAEVPAGLRNTPGLLYDRYNWLADNGRADDAIALLRAQSTSAESLGQPERWAGWRRSLARREMREGRTGLAYELAAGHYLTDGYAFSDLEWLAGYLALTYQDNAALALAHFNAARAVVDSPISVGRMEYWRGRAYEAMGDPLAQKAYQAAAEHQTSFYGLLASEKVGKPLDPALTGAGAPQDWQDAGLLTQDDIRAAVTLLVAGERRLAVSFFVSLGQSLPAADLARLGAFLAERDETYLEVLLGKTAVARGVLVPSLYYPIHDLAELDLETSPALALSIARRESEFNIGAGSPVGALGLMQLMPATAREVAGRLGLPYSKARLTSDWTYNAQLGSRYLAMLEDQFGSSPVQIAIGYNAGPSRAEIWMDDRGDPRLGSVDVVDWIEHIPFRETRNYVMRVTESLPVYQARLTGQTGPVAFTKLLIGQKPLVRPTPRPTDRPVPVAVPEAATASASDETVENPPPLRVVARPTPVLTPTTSLRPEARPGG